MSPTRTNTSASPLSPSAPVLEPVRSPRNLHSPAVPSENTHTQTVPMGCSHPAGRYTAASTRSDTPKRIRSPVSRQTFIFTTLGSLCLRFKIHHSAFLKLSRSHEAGNFYTTGCSSRSVTHGKTRPAVLRIVFFAVTLDYPPLLGDPQWERRGRSPSVRGTAGTWGTAAAHPRPLLHPRRAPSSPTPSFHSGFHGNTAPLPPFRGARVVLPASPKAQQEAAELTPGFHQRRGPAPLRPTARPAGSRPPHRRRVSPSRDRAPRAPSFPQGVRTTAATYSAGKMSPVGRRRPRSRPRCRPRCCSRCSAPPAGPPGSAGRAGGAPTMPRAPARHIHRPPLTAGLPHDPAGSVVLLMVL